MAPQTQKTLQRHMAVINSYYSNLIEGNNTYPHEIRQAQAGEFSQDRAAVFPRFSPPVESASGFLSR